jgi:hypothetical protein
VHWVQSSIADTINPLRRNTNRREKKEIEGRSPKDLVDEASGQRGSPILLMNGKRVLLELLQLLDSLNSFVFSNFCFAKLG